jgi:hypothetical protein
MMRNWKQFLLEKTEHEYSSTHVNLPHALAEKVMKFGKKLIPDSDVYDIEDYGREDDCHVTILYGLHDKTPDRVKKVVKGEKPITFEIKETSVFENEEYDVVKFTVESKDLHRLNEKLRKNCSFSSTHPKYEPHCTIAYVKKGTGKKYAGNTEFSGTTVTVDEIVFSNQYRIKTKIVLK